MTQIPIGQTFLSSVQFVLTHPRAILARIVLPLTLGWLILYLALSAYLAELEHYIRMPDQRAASLVLGLAMGGLLLALFLNAITVVALAELAMGDGEERAKLRFRTALPEWRFYAASLRVLLVSAVLLAVYLIVSKVSHVLNMGPVFAFLWGAITVVVFLYIAVRLCLLMAPVTLAERGTILRRAWALSGVQQGRILIVAGMLTVPGILTEIAGEGIVRLAGAAPALPPQVTLAGLTLVFHGMLPIFLTITAMAYAASVVLLTIGSVYVYRAAARKDG